MISQYHLGLLLSLYLKYPSLKIILYTSKVERSQKKKLLRRPQPLTPYLKLIQFEKFREEVYDSKTQLLTSREYYHLAEFHEICDSYSQVMSVHTFR